MCKYVWGMWRVCTCICAEICICVDVVYTCQGVGFVCRHIRICMYVAKLSRVDVHGVGIQVGGMYMCLHSYLCCLSWDICIWLPWHVPVRSWHSAGSIGLKGMDCTCMYKAGSLFMMLYRTCVWECPQWSGVYECGCVGCVLMISMHTLIWCDIKNLTNVVRFTGFGIASKSRPCSLFFTPSSSDVFGS